MVLPATPCEKLFSQVKPRFHPGETRFCRPHASLPHHIGVCRVPQGWAPFVALSACGTSHSRISPCAGLYACRMKLILRWLLLAAALLLVAHLYPGVSVASFGSAMIAALVLGLLNTLVRPLLVLLTLPVTVVTLGLFLFVINAAMFWSAAKVLSGLSVASFGAALIGSLIYSLCGMVIDVAMERLFGQGDRLR